MRQFACLFHSYQEGSPVSESYSPVISRAISRWCAASALLVLFGTSACATSAQQAQNKEALDQMNAVTERVEEVERTNSRLTVRMEELEDQLFLLNDRVESHRLALQRRSYKPRSATARLNTPQAPQPAPESYYYEEQGGSNVYQPRAQRPIKRIQLSDPKAQVEVARKQDPTPAASSTKEEDYEHVVISEDEYREFFGEPRSTASNSSATPSSGGRRAQPSVTSEKLGASPTTKSSSAPAAPKAQHAEGGAAPKSTGLRLYKDSLSAYRAGNYHSALVGFQAFLKSKPKRDYVDNALYWIGECYYGLGQLDDAIVHFERVLAEEPNGNKVPDAMLKMSLAFEKKGSPEQAKKVLEELVGQYPDTHAAGLGQKRLSP